jgi:nitroreductase
MLELAQRAPSWCNTQPWEVVVTEPEATERFRLALMESAGGGGIGHTSAPDFEMPSGYSGVRLDRRRESGWQLYSAVGVPRGDRVAGARQARENIRLFGAPHVAIITLPRELNTYGAVDGGVYLGYLLLAAEALGIAAVPQAALAHHAPFIRHHFGLPDDRAVLVGVSFGYADEEHPANSYRTSRAHRDDVVRWVGR